MLTLLNLSAEFDIVDHAILLRGLVSSYGFRGCVDGRTHFVRCGAFKSVPTVALCRVPQGSVLGPNLILLYTVDLVQLIQGYDLRPHLYVDDTQIYRVGQLK